MSKKMVWRVVLRLGAEAGVAVRVLEDPEESVLHQTDAVAGEEDDRRPDRRPMFGWSREDHRRDRSTGMRSAERWLGPQGR